MGEGAFLLRRAIGCVRGARRRRIFFLVPQLRSMAQIVGWESWRGARVHKLLSLFLPILLSPAVKADYYEGKRECVGNGSAYVSNARFGC